MVKSHARITNIRPSRHACNVCYALEQHVFSKWAACRDEMVKRKEKWMDLEEKLNKLRKHHKKNSASGRHHETSVFVLEENKVREADLETNTARASYEQIKSEFERESENDLNRDIREVTSEVFKNNADKNLGNLDRRFFVGLMLPDDEEERFSAFQAGWFDMSLIMNFGPVLRLQDLN